MKERLLLAILVIGLASCKSVALPATPSVSVSTPTDTLIPTALITTTPTSTLSPTEIPITKTITPEPTPYTYFDEVFVSGVNHFGSSVYGNHDAVFHTFYDEPDGFAAFRFTMQITAYHFIKSELTPTPTALPTEKWGVYVYRFRTDGNYVDQPFVDVNFTTDVIPYHDKLVMFMTADVNMDEMRTMFGDSSAFAYQVYNEQGKVQQQGNISINPHVLFHSGGGLIGDFKDGVTLGFPYSTQEREAEFFHQGKFVTIHEPESGFYRLTYTFDLAQASGIFSVSELDAMATKLAISIFPYREDGRYSQSDSYLVTGNAILVGGIYIVELPIDYLKKNSEGTYTYYLHIEDNGGTTIKDETFMFVPYVP